MPFLFIVVARRRAWSALQKWKGRAALQLVEELSIGAGEENERRPRGVG